MTLDPGDLSPIRRRPGLGFRHGNWKCGPLAILPVLAMTVLAAPPSDELLPDTTRGYLAFGDVQRAQENWDKTRPGQLMNDPIMEPFVEHLRKQMDEQGLMTYRLGLGWDDVKGIAAGELSLAYVHSGKDKPSIVLLVDVTGKTKQAQAVLDKASANLTDQGYTKSSYSQGGVSMVVHDPPDEKADLKGPRRSVSFIHGDILGVTESKTVANDIVRRFAGKHTDRLKDLPAYQATMSRCAEDAGDVAPDLRWFVDPFGFLGARRVDDPRLIPEKQPDPYEVYRREGFTAIRGVGGWVNYAQSDWDILVRAMVYAPPPYEGAMRMLRLPNQGELSPPPWMSTELGGYTSTNLDALNAFDHFGSLFDKLYGDGEEGFWDDLMDSLEHDKYGPKISVRNDLFAHLKNRGTFVLDYEQPADVDSERLLAAVEVTDAEAVTEAMEKLMEGEPTALVGELQGHKIYEVFEEEVVDEDGKPLDTPHGPPQWLISAANGHLFAASKRDLLAKVLAPEDEEKALEKSPAHQRVERELKRFGLGEMSIHAFSETDKQFGAIYELFRTGKLSEANTMMSKLFNQILAPEEKDGIRKQQIDGSKLPEFEAVRRYWGPAGLRGVSEKDGWFVKVGILPKEL